MEASIHLILYPVHACCKEHGLIFLERRVQTLPHGFQSDVIMLAERKLFHLRDFPIEMKMCASMAALYIAPLNPAKTFLDSLNRRCVFRGDA